MPVPAVVVHGVSSHPTRRAADPSRAPQPDTHATPSTARKPVSRRRRAGPRRCQPPGRTGPRPNHGTPPARTTPELERCSFLWDEVARVRPISFIPSPGSRVVLLPRPALASAENITSGSMLIDHIPVRLSAVQATRVAAHGYGADSGVVASGSTAARSRCRGSEDDVSESIVGDPLRIVVHTLYLDTRRLLGQW